MICTQGELEPLKHIGRPEAEAFFYDVIVQKSIQQLSISRLRDKTDGAVLATRYILWLAQI
jgi:hypothetical protein